MAETGACFNDNCKGRYIYVSYLKCCKTQSSLAYLETCVSCIVLIFGMLKIVDVVGFVRVKKYQVGKISSGAVAGCYIPMAR